MNNKFLLTSDIHIHDFTTNTFGDPDFRLNQFIQLAHRLVEIGKDNNIDTIVLAGDIIHVPSISPKVARTTREFIRILKDSFKEVFYTLGNHDISSKSQEDNKFQQSILPILAEFNNVKYMNGEILTLSSGKTIGFKDWLPTQDFSFIKDKVSVLVGHVCLDENFGQPFDNTGFDIAFFGDIHQPKTIGNSHTINVPLPAHISDCQDGSVILLDLSGDEIKWDRVPTESESFQYFKQYYVGEEPKGIKEELLVLRDKPIEVLDELQEVQSSLDVTKVIEETIKQNSLEDVHKQIFSLVDKTVDQLDFKFNLTSINIQNFRSIDDYKVEFEHGLSVLKGINGCFTGDTEVLDSEFNKIKLIDIVEGFKRGETFQVTSYNDKGISETSNVINAYLTKHVTKIVKVTFDGDSGYVECTPEHRFMLPSGEYIEAEKLSINQELMSANYASCWGDTDNRTNVKVLSVEEIHCDPTPVYDITVDSEHSNFALGCRPVVHNSGKSSIIGAIMFCLSGSSTQKTLIKRNTSKMKVELNLDYNQHKFKLVRGVESGSGFFNWYKDGVEFEGNSIKDRITGLQVALPWINHLYMFIRDQGVSNLLDSMNMKDRINMVNTILGLDIVGRYFSVSHNKLSELKSKETELSNQLIKLEGQKEAIDVSQFDSIVEDDAIFNSEIDQHNTTISQLNKIKEIAIKKTHLKTSIDKKRKELDYLDVGSMEDLSGVELDKVNSQIAEVTSKLNDINKKLSFQDPKIATSDTTIQLNKSSVAKDVELLEELNKSSVCYACGTELKDSSKLIKEITDRITTGKSDIDRLVEANKALILEQSEIKDGLTKELEPNNEKLSTLQDLIKRKQDYDKVMSVYQAGEQELELWIKDYDSIEPYNLEEIDKDIDAANSKIVSVRVSISENATIRISRDNFNNISKEYDKIKSDVDELSISIDSTAKYNKAFSSSGVVVNSIYSKVSEIMSNEVVRITTIKTLSSGEIRPDFQIHLKVDNIMIPYPELSGGQKTYVDMYFLTMLYKLAGGVGLLVLDETLSSLDENNVKEVVDLLKSGVINSTILVTHLDNFPYYDQKFNIMMENNSSIIVKESNV